VQIVGAPAECVAIVPSVSAGAGIVAANLPPATRGENVVVAENEFNSNYFPWRLHEIDRVGDVLGERA
jgi:cysteine desulfurase / selenocysteine lyase